MINTRLARNTADSLANSALGLAISHTPINPESLAAQALGNTMAQEIGNKVQGYMKDRRDRAEHAAQKSASHTSPDRTASTNLQHTQATNDTNGWDREMQLAEKAAYMQLANPQLDLKLGQMLHTNPDTYVMSEMNRCQMQQRQRYNQIHDPLDRGLDLAAKLTRDTLFGSAVEYARNERVNLRTVYYGDSSEKWEALKHVGTEVGIGAVGGAVGRVGLGLAARYGLFGGRNVGLAVESIGAESVETLANRALNPVRLAQNKTPATNPNAAEALSRKYKALEGAQSGSVKTETLSDGRIRYYEKEKLARNPGPTRGTSYVTEYNPNTGDVHTWMESYDHLGNVNRVHPKMSNGQTLNAPHYPPTLKDKLESEYYLGYRG